MVAFLYPVKYQDIIERSTVVLLCDEIFAVFASEALMMGSLNIVPTIQSKFT